MRPVRQSLSAAGVTVPVIVDIYPDPFNLSLSVSLSNTPNLTYNVEYTTDDVFSSTFNPATANWTAVTGFSALTAGNSGNIAFPVRAVRLNVTAYTSGTATLSVIQAGIV